MLEVLVRCPSCRKQFTLLCRETDPAGRYALPPHNVVRGVSCPSAGKPVESYYVRAWEDQSATEDTDKLLPVYVHREPPADKPA